MSRLSRLTKKDVVQYLEEDFPSGSELESDVDDSDKDPNYENDFILDSSDSDCDVEDSNNQNDIITPANSLETSITSSSRTPSRIRLHATCYGHTQQTPQIVSPSHSWLIVDG